MGIWAVGKENASFFYPISIVEKGRILDECKRIKPVGICSIASDLATITVNYVAEILAYHAIKLSIIQYKQTEIRFIISEEDLNELEIIKKKNPEIIHRISNLETENLGKTKDSSTRVVYYIIKE